MPDNQTNSQPVPSDDPVASQLKSYADSIVASDPAASQLGHYADVLERKDKVSKANQIVSEVQSGKRPEMNEQDLLPVMKVASLDPETGKLTTPSGRAGSALKSFNKLWFDSEAPNWYQKVTVPGMAAITGGKFLTTPAMRENAGNAIDTISQGVKGFGKEAAEGDSGQGVLNELGGLVGGTAKWAQGTGIQAGAGVLNVGSQALGTDDPDLTNAKAALLQGKINRGITIGEETVGVQPESYAYSAGANVGPFLLPPYGAEELASATTKAVRGTEALASKAVGVPMEYGAKAASGTAKVITKPLNKIPFGLGSVPRQYMVGLSEGLTDPIEIVGRALRGKDSTMVEGLARETQKSIADDQATIDYVTKKHELKSDDAVFQKKPSGQWMFDDASPMLSKEEKEVRAAQQAMAWKQSALGAIEKTKGLNDIVNYARDIGLVGNANTAVGSAIGGGLSAVNAPPGEESQAAQIGGAFGALLAGVPGHYGAWRDVSKAMQGERAATNAKMLDESGSKIAPQSQNLSPEAQSLINKTAAVINQADGATIQLHPGDEFLKFSQDVMAKKRPEVIPIVEPATQPEGVQAAPNGYYDSVANVLHLNENEVNADPMLVGHEVGHFTQKLYGRMLDQARPDLVSAMDKAYAEAMSKTGRTPSFNSRSERDAEVGRILLEQTPIENFYGGKRIFDTLDPQNIINAIKGRFGGYKVDPTLKAPYSQDDLNQMKQRMFQVGEEAAKAPRNAPAEPQATSVPQAGQTQPIASTQAPTKPLEQVVGEVDQAARPRVIPVGGVDPQEAVDFLVKMGQTKESAIAKAHAAVQDLKGEGTPITLENIVKKAMQRAIPKPVDAVNEIDQIVKSQVLPSQQLSQAQARPISSLVSDKVQVSPQSSTSIISSSRNEPNTGEHISQAQSPQNEEPSRTPTETVPQEATEPTPERGVESQVQVSTKQSQPSLKQAETIGWTRENVGEHATGVPAIRVNETGDVFEGKFHPDALDKAQSVYQDLNFRNVDAGFVKDGKFYTSSQAKEPSTATSFEEDTPKHPDYEAIRTETESAKREELAGTRRKTKDAEISRAGLEAMAQAHAKHVGDDADLVTWRTDRFGDTSIGGKRLDLDDPFHQHLIEKVGLTPKQVEYVNQFSVNMGKLLGLENYSHAAKEGEASGVSRKAEQKESTAQQRAEKKGDTQNAPVNIVPTWIKFNQPSNRVTVHGFNPDKLLSNAAKLESYPESGFKKAYPKGVNDPQIVQDLSNWLVNNRNGFTGDGRKQIEGTPLTQVKPNEDYKPAIIPHDRFQVLNAMMGSPEPMGKTPKSADAQILGQQNAGFVRPNESIFNQVRAKLAEKGDVRDLLENVNESLRPENISGKVSNEPVEDEHLLRPSGAKPETVKAIADVIGEKGTPRYSQSGFMPATPKHLDGVAKEMGLRYDGPSLGGKAHQFTDDKTKSSIDVPADATPEQVKEQIATSRSNFEEQQLRNFAGVRDAHSYNGKFILDGPAGKVEIAKLGQRQYYSSPESALKAARKYMRDQVQEPPVQFMPKADDKRAIRSAAVRFPDGRIFEDWFHPTAFAEGVSQYSVEQLAKWIREHGEHDYIQTGFTTNGGEFLDRHQALERAKEIGQVTDSGMEEARKHFGGLSGPRGLESLNFTRARKFKRGGVVKVPKVVRPLSRASVGA